jgi:hypothetical protein
MVCLELREKTVGPRKVKERRVLWLSCRTLLLKNFCVALKPEEVVGTCRPFTDALLMQVSRS